MAYYVAIARLPGPTPFPYTTLFRSPGQRRGASGEARREGRAPRAGFAGFGLLSPGRQKNERSVEHTSEPQSPDQPVCRLLRAQDITNSDRSQNACVLGVNPIFMQQF